MTPKKFISVDGFQYQLVEPTDATDIERMTTAAQIIKQVCSAFDTTPEEIFVRSRKMKVIQAKHCCMYLLTKLTSFSLKDIGDIFDLDHTSVIHARDKIQGYIDTRQQYIIPLLHVRENIFHHLNQIHNGQ